MSCPTSAFISYGVTVTPDDLDGEFGGGEPRNALALAVGVDPADHTDHLGDNDVSDFLWLYATAKRILRRKPFGVWTFGSYAEGGSAWVLGVRFVYVDGDGFGAAEFDPAAIARKVARLKRDRVLQAAFARVRKALPTVDPPSVVCGVMLRGG